jgi:hypothetical protein
VGARHHGVARRASPQPWRGHCSAAANARAATDRPEPAGPGEEPGLGHGRGVFRPRGAAQRRPAGLADDLVPDAHGAPVRAGDRSDPLRVGASGGVDGASGRGVGGPSAAASVEPRERMGRVGGRAGRPGIRDIRAGVLRLAGRSMRTRAVDRAPAGGGRPPSPSPLCGPHSACGGIGDVRTTPRRRGRWLRRRRDGVGPWRHTERRDGAGGRRPWRIEGRGRGARPARIADPKAGRGRGRLVAGSGGPESAGGSSGRGPTAIRSATSSAVPSASTTT